MVGLLNTYPPLAVIVSVINVKWFTLSGAHDSGLFVFSASSDLQISPFVGLRVCRETERVVCSLDLAPETPSEAALSAWEVARQLITWHGSELNCSCIW